MRYNNSSQQIAEIENISPAQHCTNLEDASDPEYVTLDLQILLNGHKEMTKEDSSSLQVNKQETDIRFDYQSKSDSKYAKALSAQEMPMSETVAQVCY